MRPGEEQIGTVKLDANDTGLRRDLERPFEIDRRH
jgi:hypothetical protein